MYIKLVLEDSPMFYDWLSEQGYEKKEFEDMPLKQKISIWIDYANSHKEDAEIVTVEF